MSKEVLSGPQQVALAAGRMQECPHIAGYPEAVADISGGSYGSSDRLIKFAGAKIITDELADRLPNMQAKFPRYGLPEPQKPNLGADTPLRSSMAWLNSGYKAKLDTHVDDEIAVMIEDPRFQPIIEALDNIDDRIKSGSINNIETITGLLSIMPEILGHDMAHAEIVAIARNSQRLPILPSLSGQAQLDAFRLAATDGETQQPWGFTFRPDLFSVHTDRRTQRIYLDYANGIESIDLADYWEDQDRLTEEYLSGALELVRNQGRLTEEDKTHRPETLGEFAEMSSALSCPARKLILVTWADMLDIVDSERMFELGVKETETAKLISLA